MLRDTKKWRDNKRVGFYRIIFFAYLPILLFATLMPADIVSSNAETWISKLKLKNEDKVIHFTLFFIFTFLFILSDFIRNKKLVLITSILLGISIEILQFIMNLGRSFEFLDIVANTLGAFIAYYILRKRI